MSASEKMIVKERDSNIELYRIIVMLAIVAHHFVVNSGLLEVMYENPTDIRTSYLWLLGMWGKTGINCFVLITGWFMCTSRITLRKFLKLFLEIVFYNIVIGSIFYVSGYQDFSWGGLLRMIWPVWKVSDGFISCYLLFFLFIPFLNILIGNMTRKQHLLLLMLCLGIYTGLGSMPFCKVSINYVTWFIVLYILGSFISIYPAEIYERRSFWGWMTVCSTILSMVSVFVISRISINHTYFFVADSYKILAVVVAICSFFWFKNLDIKQSKVINTIASSTFGVLLIHANSDTMRRWLWRDVLDNVGQYDADFLHLVLTSCGSIVGVFAVCVVLDQVRIHLIETPFFRWYDRCCRYKT